MLVDLQISNLRIVNAKLALPPGVLTIWGDNGSGKSSILEAIHFLAFGRSFRASNADAMIAKTAPYFSIQANVVSSSLPKSISVVRERGKTQAKLMGDKSSMSKIAALLPTLFVDCDSHRHYFSSASNRRRLFDWLSFHVEPGYLKPYRAYHNALKQRNRALKVGANTTPWDAVLDQYVTPLLEISLRVNQLLQEVLANNAFFQKHGLSLAFLPGYDANEGLDMQLQRVLAEDRRLGRTTLGIHKSDWRLMKGCEDAVFTLSQGQQKTAYLEMVFSQYQVLKDQNATPLILVDDLGAELDLNHRSLISDFLHQDGAQAIITTILESDAVRFGGEVFHVEQGVMV